MFCLRRTRAVLPRRSIQLLGGARNVGDEFEHGSSQIPMLRPVPQSQRLDWFPVCLAQPSR